jgi:hypothetical protein
MKKLFLSLLVALCALIGTLYHNGQNKLSKAKYEANLCGSTDMCISDALKNNGFDLDWSDEVTFWNIIKSNF